MTITNGILTCVEKKDLLLLNTNPYDFWRGIEVIGERAFAKYDVRHLLTKIKIPNTVKKIEEQAFAFTNLQRIVLSESILSIGAFAFAGTQIEKLEVPRSVKQLGAHIVYKCEKLKEIKVPRHLHPLCSDILTDTLHTDCKITLTSKENADHTIG